jgi:hypothetical protein
MWRTTTRMVWITHFFKQLTLWSYLLLRRTCYFLSYNHMDAIVVHNITPSDQSLSWRRSQTLSAIICSTWVFCHGRESIIGHVTPYVDNPADICTKVVPGGQKRNHLIRLLLHDLCDWTFCLSVWLSSSLMMFSGIGVFSLLYGQLNT